VEVVPLDSLPLTDGVVVVRPFAAADAPVVADATRDDEIVRWTLTDEAMPADRIDQWIADAVGDLRDGTTMRLAIVDAAADAPVGQIGIAPDWQHEIGEIFYWMTAAARGRGLTTRAVRLVTAWGLGPLALARVEISVDSRNAPSLAVARAAGFVEEGRLRSAHVFKGERIDTVLFSRLPTDT